ncbi:quinone oxidoreductase family protein [Kitasatospora sp. NPDC059795]|uniref:quinone oxidoreductase family protein n=1 Tax=Kitasatospora sp. NPDC059795 TaxID=3346949 RepID=UPI003647883B
MAEAGQGVMDAVVLHEPGGPEQLRFEQFPVPTPGPGEALVEVAAAGVNFVDLYLRSGRYPVPMPAVLGQEGAGVVRAFGPDTDPHGLRVGDRVAWANVRGAYAQFAVVPAERLVPVPDAIDDRTAAAVLLQGMTAHYLVHDSHPVRPGQNVLVQAAAGGLGLLLTQWVTLLGGRVIGTVSTAEKEQLARKAGAAEVVRYGPDAGDVPLSEQVRALTGGEGVAAVYDGVGAATFAQSLASLRPRGTLVLHGAASGPVDPVDPALLQAGGSLFLTRPDLTHHIRDRSELLDRARAVFDGLARGMLRLDAVGDRPLHEAAQAHADLAGRRVLGKVVLVPAAGSDRRQAFASN